MIRRILALLLGLFAVSFGNPAQAQDVPECRNPAYFERFLMPGAGASSCQLVAQDRIRWNGHSARIRIIRTSSSAPVDRTGAAAGLRTIADSAGRALARLGPDAMIDNVTLLLGDEISPAGAGGYEVNAGAFGAWTPDIIDGDCPVYLFKSQVARTRDYAAETIIHELFHCVQHRMWGYGVRAEGWMSEGSAEYFVDLARPGRSSPGISDFDSQIGARSLGAMTYQANPFFLWYGDSNGPPAFLHFVRDQRAIGAMIDPAMWQSFAKAYFDGRVHMPDGSAMPSHPSIETMQISASTRLQFGTGAPFTLKARDLTFRKPKGYRLAMPPLSPEFFLQWRGASGGEWGEAPSEIKTGCKDVSYRAIWGGTLGAEQVDANVTASPGPAAGCSCPAGVWTETPESTRRYFEQSALGAYGGGTRKRFVGGQRVLTLNSDHTGSLTYNNIQVMTGEGTDMVLDQVQSGVSTFTWKVVGGKLLTVWSAGSGRVTLNNTITVRGSSRHEVRQAGMQSIGHDFSCDGTGLHLRTGAHVPSYLPAGMTSTFSADMDFQQGG